MKTHALTAALITLLAVISVPLMAKLGKLDEQAKQPPKKWQKLEWEEKKEILFGYYAPSEKELRLIAEAMPKQAKATPKKERKILLFYQTAGFSHTSIAPGVAAFEKMASQTGAFSIDSTDDPSQFTKENLARYDAVLLNNSVNFDKLMTEEERNALVGFVKGGKGLVGIHGASDACKNWNEGAQMVGSVFRFHPWNSKGFWPAKVESPEHVLNQVWKGKSTVFQDEIYCYRENPVLRDRARVLLSLDMSKEENMTGQHLNKKLIKFIKKDGDYPIAWIQQYDQGRVFYSNLGHNRFTFWDPKVLEHFLDGIQYALGDIEADATPLPAPTTPAAQEDDSQ